MAAAGDDALHPVEPLSGTGWSLAAAVQLDHILWNPPQRGNRQMSDIVPFILDLYRFEVLAAPVEWGAAATGPHTTPRDL